MRVRPVARVGSRKSTQCRIAMIAAEAADPLAVVLDRRLRAQSPALATPVIIRPTHREGRDRLFGPSRRAFLCGEDLALDPSRLPQARRRLKAQRADLHLRDVALARRPRVVDLDDRPPVLDPRAHAVLRTSCQSSHSERRYRRTAPKLRDGIPRTRHRRTVRVETP